LATEELPVVSEAGPTVLLRTSQRARPSFSVHLFGCKIWLVLQRKILAIPFHFVASARNLERLEANEHIFFQQNLFLSNKIVGFCLDCFGENSTTTLNFGFRSKSRVFNRDWNRMSTFSLNKICFCRTQNYGLLFGLFRGELNHHLEFWLPLEI